MDSFQLSLIIIPPICAAIGFILKSLCNKYSKQNELKRKDNLIFVEAYSSYKVYLKLTLRHTHLIKPI